MVEVDNCLIRCFSSVFPTLTEEEIRAADVTLLSDMDSLTGVTLVALIDQEFGMKMELEDLLKLGTFEAIKQFVRDQSFSDLPPQEQAIK